MADALEGLVAIDGADALRIALAVPLLYGAVIAFVRVSGKRTTSQMNGFDWVVTVANGSLLASGMLPGGASAIEAALAIAILFALQWLVTFAVSRSGAAEEAVKATPRLLLHRGEPLRDAMLAERVNLSELRAAVREAGHTRLEDVEWVILETDASLSVAVSTDTSDPRTALVGVRGAEGPDTREGQAPTART